MSAHTPGPWFQASLSLLDIVTDTDTMVAYAREGLNTIPREEALANARLIAAAPDLAATLAAVADYWAGGDAPPELEARIHTALRAAGVAP